MQVMEFCHITKKDQNIYEVKKMLEKEIEYAKRLKEKEYGYLDNFEKEGSKVLKELKEKLRLI